MADSCVTGSHMTKMQEVFVWSAACILSNEERNTVKIWYIAAKIWQHSSSHCTGMFYIYTGVFEYSLVIHNFLGTSFLLGPHVHPRLPSSLSYTIFTYFPDPKAVWIILSNDIKLWELCRHLIWHRECLLLRVFVFENPSWVFALVHHDGRNPVLWRHFTAIKLRRKERETHLFESAVPFQHLLFLNRKSTARNFLPLTKLHRRTALKSYQLSSVHMVWGCRVDNKKKC